VTSTRGGIASSATGGFGVCGTMRMFITGSTGLAVRERKHVFNDGTATTGHEEALATVACEEKKSAGTGDISN